MKQLLKNVIPEGGKSRVIILFVAFILIIGIIIAYLNMDKKKGVVTASGPGAGGRVATLKSPDAIPGGPPDITSLTAEQEQAKLIKARDKKAADDAKGSMSKSSLPQVTEGDIVALPGKGGGIMPHQRD